MERWLVGVLLLMLTVNMGFINYMAVKELRKPLCVFDVQRFIDFLSSQDIGEKEAELILTEAKNFLDGSECRMVFVKGALIVGDAKDMTGEVIRRVKDLRETAK
ncbi:MAG TPA: hypothetical protein EYP20_02490 [Aigarchaeota archaeon]|nr:hypothetical protein [Aigarchaeota archaeon]